MVRSVSVLLLALLCGCDPTPTVSVYGKLVAQVRTKGERQLVPVYLPGLDVTLRSKDGTVGPRKSDLSGRFAFARIAVGAWEVCWSGAGYVSSCATRTIGADGGWLGDLPVQLEKESAAMFGQVYFADHSLPRAVQPDVGLNAFATVTAEGGTTAFVNDDGYYLLPGLTGGTQVTARIENEALTRVYDASALVPGAPLRADFRLGNSPPRILGVRATRSGAATHSAEPGETLGLEVTTTDVDGDPVHVRWIPAGGVADQSAPRTEWTLGKGRGDNRVDVLVWDERGGYDREILHVSTLEAPMTFSGRVVDAAGAAVAGATIDVNGVEVTSNALGGFHAAVKENGRYVMNVRKSGFGLWSQVTDSAIQGATVRLVTADVRSGSPAAGFTLTEKRDPRTCRGPISAGAKRDVPEARRTPIVLDPVTGLPTSGPASDVVKRTLAELRDQRKTDCGPGVTVTFPPGSLAPTGGGPAAASVDVALSSIHPLSPQQMPGDWTVRIGDKSAGYAQTFGAASIDVSAGGVAYNLVPGATAELRMPIAASQLAGAPATMPLLTYDERTGEWLQDGTWKRDGSEYVTKVPHLSTFNADLVKSGQSCVRLDISQLPTSAIELELTIPGNPPEVRTPFVRAGGTSDWTALYNLPESTDIILVPYAQGTTVPYGTFVVNTGPAQTPTTPNQPDLGPDPGSPYPACHATAVLSVVNVPDPAAPDAFLAGLDTFHAGILSETFPTNLPNPGYVGDTLATAYRSATERYYNLVDAGHLRDTLDEFKAHHHFGDVAAVGDDVEAAYANENDLGFGRRMHCRKNGAEVACYVTNFGSYSTDDVLDFQAAVDDLDPGTPDSAGAIATVAMEFAPLENSGGTPSGSPVVKFFVYRGDGTSDGVVDVNEAVDADGDGDPDADGDRLVAADLDELGARPVPQLCMVCHGGNALQGWTIAPPADEVAAVNALFTSTTEADLSSHFLAFDLEAFYFDNTYNAGYTQGAQEEEFAWLNTMVKATEPVGSTISTLVDALNPGGAFPQVVSPVVPSWSLVPADATFYREVFGPRCRGCHAARPADLDFDTPAEILGQQGAVAYRVCSTRQMPHARRTYQLFWNSLGPNEPAQLQAYGMNSWGWAAGTCAPAIAYYPADNPGPVTLADFQGAVSVCSGCHPGGTSAAGCDNVGSALGWDPNDPLTFRDQPSVEQSALEIIDSAGGAAAVANSYLFHKVNGPPACGQQMPPPTGGLSSADLTTIQAWILAGTPN